MAAARTADGHVPFVQLPPEQMVRMAYEVVLGREPDPTGMATHLEALSQGETPWDAVQRLVGSEEFEDTVAFTQLTRSLHSTRCAFIRSLPQARRILDLGGTHLLSADGALVGLGYPYDIEEIVLVDLPPDDRHPMYASFGGYDVVHTRRGPVRYAYHSMVDLDRYDDDSFDLVYSGQTFEHVSEQDGDTVLAGALRVLRPGGHLALDTPNGRVTRIQQEAFIDPDHEVEYDEPTLSAKIRAAGFEIVSVSGMHYSPAAADGVFDPAELIRNRGLYDRAQDCYLLAYLCRKPG